jgi:diguanylate cyclase (GGDEF)-like protein
VTEKKRGKGKSSRRDAEAPGSTSSARSAALSWSPELIETLQDLLRRAGPDALDLGAELKSLERRYGPGIYSEWLRFLGHLRFEPVEAKRHWQATLQHRSSMEERLGAAVDPRVALTSYLVETQPEFESSIVVEMHPLGQSGESAYRDDLTGLRNHRFFSENLEREVLRGERLNQPLSLLMVDVDDFKLYNEREGHEAGDGVLRTIARLLRESSRITDGVSRFGGEEFTLTLPATPKVEANRVADRVRKAIEQRAFPGEDKQPLGKLTVSVGVATYPGDAVDASQLIRQSDRTMYVAKANGKNQVRLCGENKRSHRRVKVVLDGEVRIFGGDYRPLRTMDLSSGGMKFSTEDDLPVGALADLRLRIPGSEAGIEMAVRVVEGRTVRPPGVGWIAGREQAVGGSYEVAARILEIRADDLRTLTHYLQSVETLD